MAEFEGDPGCAADRSDCLAVSNDPAGIERFTGRVVPLAPQRQFFGSSEATGMLDGFVHRIE
jgi:hypothetical protein